MATVVFHGPNDSNECRNAVRKLAKQWGGKFSYNSFWNGKRNCWFSENTMGKAAYSVHNVPYSRSEMAALVRKIRRECFAPGLKYKFTHCSKQIG